MRAGWVAGIALFGLAVLPFSALLEPTPSIAVDFWRGGATLRIQRTMTVERTYPVVLVVSEPKEIGGLAPAPTTGGSGSVDPGGDSLVAHLSGEPRSAFAIVPDKDEAKALSGKGDLRWAWDATPRQEGPQRLFLELVTTVKTPAGTTAKGNVYRQFILITVQAPDMVRGCPQMARRRRLGTLTARISARLAGQGALPLGHESRFVPAPVAG